MKMKNISVERLEYMIQRLENAIEICHIALENGDCLYATASASYAGSCMQETVEQLKELMNTETGDLY